MKRLSITKDQVDRAVLLAAAAAETRDERLPPSDEATPIFSGDLMADLDKISDLYSTPEYVRLHEFLTNLTRQQLRELRAIMYTGRGDWSAREFWAHCDELPMADDLRDAVVEVMGRASLFDQLSNGFEKLNHAGIV